MQDDNKHKYTDLQDDNYINIQTCRMVLHKYADLQDDAT